MLSLYLGPFFILFSTFVIVGASNAVNLTDGLDGLAVGPTITTSVTFLILAYCAGHVKIAEYLQIPHIPGAGELAIFLASVAASCLGFFGSILIPRRFSWATWVRFRWVRRSASWRSSRRTKFLLAICGGIFVLEALSVMAQVASFKMTGKRVFKMAPIHHHFEFKGWAEPKVIVRFWIISVLLGVGDFIDLKTEIDVPGNV